MNSGKCWTVDNKILQNLQIIFLVTDTMTLFPVPRLFMESREMRRTWVVLSIWRENVMNSFKLFFQHCVARLTKPAGTMAFAAIYILTVPRTVWHTCVSSFLSVQKIMLQYRQECKAGRFTEIAAKKSRSLIIRENLRHLPVHAISLVNSGK
jgi:hypothetical protein